jgi:hypothetical protein
MSLKYAFAGLLVGAMISLAPSCGQQPKTCNASNCSSGCCDTVCAGRRRELERLLVDAGIGLQRKKGEGVL